MEKLLSIPTAYMLENIEKISMARDWYSILFYNSIIPHRKSSRTLA